jgi:multiple sugar transport system substrate-binding protein
MKIAETFHRKDLNGDGRPDFGSCIAKKRNAQSYWMVWSVAAGFLQTQGTSQGSFFDLDTMRPLVDNEAFAEALRVYVATGRFGPPDELNWDVGDSRAGFTSGRCALTIDWGDIGTLAIDPKTSKVKDKVGAVILPGTRRVLDRRTGRLVSCTSALCPHARAGVNHAPFAAFGGWSGGINASAPARVKDAAYAFFSHMSQPAQANVDVTIGITGFNPYRASQFKNIAPWVKAGMSEAAARNYLGAIEASLNSPNMVLDLRIPQNQRYQQVVLDTAVAKLLAKQTSIDDARKEIVAGWEAITNELGRDAQLRAYLASLGVRR